MSGVSGLPVTVIPVYRRETGDHSITVFMISEEEKTLAVLKYSLKCDIMLVGSKANPNLHDLNSTLSMCIFPEKPTYFLIVCCSLESCIFVLIN